MACARIYEGFFLSTKRVKTEMFVLKAGHKWPAQPFRGPTTAAECIVTLLASIDRRNDPHGDLSEVSDQELEFDAGWTGAPGLFVRALTECGWIDVSKDGKSRRWHDYGHFNSKTIVGRANGEKGGRPKEPGSTRSRGIFGGRALERTKRSGAEPGAKPGAEPGANSGADTSGSGSGLSSESEGGRGEDASPACPRPQPPGSPPAASRTDAGATPSGGEEDTSDDGGDIDLDLNPDGDDEPILDPSDPRLTPAKKEALIRKLAKETPAQTAIRLKRIKFEHELTQMLHIARPIIARRWNETIDQLDREFPLEDYPKRARWVRYETFPASRKIRSALRARVREALTSKPPRKFSDDFEFALLGVKSMSIWSSHSPTWRPNLLSFFVASKWETKIAAGKQLKGDEERAAEKERLEAEVFDKQYSKIETEANERRARNGQVTS